MHRQAIAERLERKKILNTRAGSSDKANRLLNKSKSRPLYEKLEREYNSRVLLPELSKSKEILKQRKKYMKPVRHSDLMRHEKYGFSIKFRKYLSDLESHINKLKKVRRKEHKQHTIKIDKKFSSKLIDKIKERDMVAEYEEQKRKEDRIRIKERMNLYAQLAMESHRPKVSSKKREELQNIIENLSHKPRQPNPKVFDKRDMSSYKSYSSAKNGLKKAQNRSKNHSQISHTPSLHSSKFKEDWNTKMRLKRQQREEIEGPSQKPYLVKEILQASNHSFNKGKDDYDLIKEKVRAVEEQAQRKERMLQTKGKEAEDYEEVNTMLISSIKAKLALLKGID